jgi:WD40 repeat protein
VKSLAVYQDVLFSGSADTTIRQWDLQTGKCLSVWKQHRKGIEKIQIYVSSHDGIINLYSASSDGSIKKWNIDSGQVIHSFEAHHTSVYALAFMNDFMFSASADKRVLKWDLQVRATMLSTL